MSSISCSPNYSHVLQSSAPSAISSLSGLSPADIFNSPQKNSFFSGGLPARNCSLSAVLLCDSPGQVTAGSREKTEKVAFSSRCLPIKTVANLFGSPTNAPSLCGKRGRDSSQKSSSVLSLEKFSEASKSPFISNAQGISFNKKLLDGKNGQHCDVFVLEEGQNRFFARENMPENSSLVFKFFNEKNIRKNGMELVNDMIPALSKQYKAIEKKYESIENPAFRPYASIFNIDTIEQDGYIVQERVVPCSLQTIKENRLYQEKIKEWFHDCLLDVKSPGWDLFKRNLGERILENGTKILVIFDYYEYSDEFFLSAHEYIDDLALDVPGFREYILDGLKEKIELHMDPSWYKDRFLKLTEEMKVPKR